MRRFFVAGIVAGAAMTHTGIAQDSSPRALSHVGIAVKNFDEALGYYTKTLGFREAYSMADPGLTPGKALFTRLRDRDGVSIEAMEFGPEAQQRRAMNAWKP